MTNQISDRNFKRLQAISRPLLDTIDTVIERLLDHYESTGPKAARLAGPPVENKVRDFDPASVPSFTHTKILRASFAGEEIERPNWNELVRRAVELSFKKTGSLDEVRRITAANIVKGQKTDEGYSPIGGLDCSVQGVDSQDAWRIAYGTARKLVISIEVTLEWRDKEGAAYPGEVGRIAWHPARD